MYTSNAGIRVLTVNKRSTTLCPCGVHILARSVQASPKCVGSEEKDHLSPVAPQWSGTLPLGVSQACASEPPSASFRSW